MASSSSSPEVNWLELVQDAELELQEKKRQKKVQKKMPKRSQSKRKEKQEKEMEKEHLDPPTSIPLPPLPFNPPRAGPQMPKYVINLSPDGQQMQILPGNYHALAISKSWLPKRFNRFEIPYRLRNAGAIAFDGLPVKPRKPGSGWHMKKPKSSEPPPAAAVEQDHSVKRKRNNAKTWGVHRRGDVKSDYSLRNRSK